MVNQHLTADWDLSKKGMTEMLEEKLPISTYFNMFYDIEINEAVRKSCDFFIA